MPAIGLTEATARTLARRIIREAPALEVKSIRDLGANSGLYVIDVRSPRTGIELTLNSAGQWDTVSRLFAIDTSEYTDDPAGEQPGTGKRGRGRPRLPESQRLDATPINVYVTKRDSEIIEAAAAILGQEKSTFCRTTVVPQARAIVTAYQKGLVDQEAGTLMNTPEASIAVL